jgi:hypothetical protein
MIKSVRVQWKKTRSEGTPGPPASPQLQLVAIIENYWYKYTDRSGAGLRGRLLRKRRSIRRGVMV